MPIDSSSPADLQVLKSNGAFTNKLYKFVAHKRENFLMSPINIHQVLTMSYLGASGSTAEAYISALNLPMDRNIIKDGYDQITTKLKNVPSVTLLVANKLYINEGSKLKENFINAIVEKFHAEIQALNFVERHSAAATINAFVEEKTKNKIKNLVSASDFDYHTRIVLVNAVYFKGIWNHKFDTEATKVEPFFLNKKDTVNVEMMHLTKNLNFKQDDFLNARVVELAYSNTDVSILFILPYEKDGIRDLERRLEKTDLNKITKDMFGTEVQLAVPKFKIEATIELEEPLRKLGLGEIFDPKQADFSNITESGEKLHHVSKVVQKAYLEVNEQGAEAAAAAGCIRIPLSFQYPRELKLNHPFVVICVVRNYSVKIPLFIGRLVNPVPPDS